MFAQISNPYYICKDMHDSPCQMIVCLIQLHSIDFPLISRTIQGYLVQHPIIFWNDYDHTATVDTLQPNTIILGNETGTYATDCPAHSSVKYASRHVHMDLEKNLYLYRILF